VILVDWQDFCVFPRDKKTIQCQYLKSDKHLRSLGEYWLLIVQKQQF